MKTGYGYKLFEMDMDGKLYPLFIGKNKGKRPKSLPNHTDLAYCLIVEKKQKESV